MTLATMVPVNQADKVIVNKMTTAMVLVNNHMVPDNKRATIMVPVNRAVGMVPDNKRATIMVPVNRAVGMVPDNRRATIMVPVNKATVQDNKVLTTAPVNKAAMIIALVNKAAIIALVNKDPVAMVQGLPAVNTTIMVNNNNSKLQATVAAMIILKVAAAALNTEEQALPMILMDPAMDLVNKVAVDLDLAIKVVMEILVIMTTVEHKVVDNRVMEINAVNKAVNKADMEGMTAIIEGCS